MLLKLCAVVAVEKKRAHILAISRTKRAKIPPFKRLPKSEVAATEQGLDPITQFFKPKTKAGRP